MPTPPAPPARPSNWPSPKKTAPSSKATSRNAAPIGGWNKENWAAAKDTVSRMTSDERFKMFVSTRAQAPARWPQSDRLNSGDNVSRQPFAAQPQSVELPIIRKEWNNSQKYKPSPSNPFGEALGKTNTRDDVPMPSVAPEIREMAAGKQPLDRDVVTQNYIKDIAKQDNDLASKLAGKYLDSYMSDASSGLVPLMRNEEVDELTKLSGRDYSAQGALDIAGQLVSGLFKTIDTVTRAPIRAGAYETLAVGFENQPKNIDPTKLKPADAAAASVANVDTGKLPWYYRRQLDVNQSPLEEALYPSDPGQPEANPEKHAAYQAITDNILQQREDWDYYSDFATAADGVNTLFSTPQIRQAYTQGKALTPEQNENILRTGNIAGLTSFARVTQLVKSIKDAGVMIDPEDRISMRSGWSAETVDKYATRLSEQGQNLSEIVLGQGLTWPELKRALDLANLPGQDQADIARSLGFKVSAEADEPIYAPYMQTGKLYTGAQDLQQTGSEHKFNVDNPDQVVGLEDIRAKADTKNISGAQLAALIGQKYTYAYFADVKTVPFQDLAAMIAFDPTNFGKLQLIWEPVGLLFKAGGKAAKEIGKGVYYSGALVGDVGVGSMKTISNLVGKLRGVEQDIIKPENWTGVSAAAKYLVSETSQSVTNKISNRASFVVKSIMAPEYIQDGESTLRWVEEVFPKLQDAARSGDWTPFIKEVPAGAGDYAASGLNSIGNDLRRIAADEDAFGHFADSILKPFGEFTKDDTEQLRKLVSSGDYAGVTRLIADKTVSSRVTNKFTIDEARKSINASDLLNQATTAYRSGIHVLTQKSLGDWGKDVVSPAAARINDMLSTVSRQWTNAVLTARPGWNVINYLDNSARLIANGFNPSADAKDLERKLVDLGVTPTQMREIIYGGNFLDEAVRLNVPVTPEMIEASKFASRVTVDSTPQELASLVELANRASDSLKDVPAEARGMMDDAVGRLRVEAEKLAKGKGDVKAVRSAASKVDNVANQMFGKSATVDTSLFKSRLDTLREYGNILKSGNGKAITRIWDNWVEVGHAVHRDIEAAARMRVFAPTYIDKYHEALGQLARDLPQFPDEAQLTQRFAHIADDAQRAEAVREANLAYQELGQRLNGLVNEAALNPSKLPDVQDYLQQLRTDPRSAARSFLFSTQPVIDGTTPAADVLMQKIADWSTDVFDGASMVDLRDPARVREFVDQVSNRINNRLKVESAEANLMARTNEIIKPSTKMPNSAANWLQDGQVTNMRDIAVTAKRMEKMSADVEAVNREFSDGFLELNHGPYLSTLDAVQRTLPDRAHRYDLMRSSFADKFAGEARYGDETVRVVGGTLDKERGVVALLEDGRIVPSEAVQFNDAQRGWYFQQYSKWEKAKPSGNDVLSKSGIGNVTGTGAKMRKPAYVETGTPGMVPPDVARGYTRRLEDDIVAKGGALPTEYVDADGVKHMLAYDSADDFIQRFASGSGLGFYKSQGNLIEGVQRTADNWTHLAKLADANDIEDLSGVLVNGRRVSEVYPDGMELETIKKRIFSEKSAKVQISYEHNGTRYVLTNDPKRGETLTDVTRRLWRDKIEGVYIETRGQWVPVFDPNAAAGSRISFKQLGRDDALESVRIPVETGTSIPDEMGEQLLKIQDAAEPVEQIGIEIEASLAKLDNILRAAPELPPFSPDFTLGGAEVMSTGKMKLLPDGSYGYEISHPDGRLEVVPSSALGTIGPEAEVPMTGEGVLLPETPIPQLDIAAEFMKRHPTLQSRDELLARGQLLREQGVPVEDEQLSAMADILEALSQHMFKQEPDFLLKRVSLTAEAPTKGLYQRINLDTPEFKKFFEGSAVTGDYAMSKAARGGAGAPLVMYHGTPSAGFEAFNLSKAKSEGLYGPGIYMTDDPVTATGLFDDAGNLKYKGYATTEERWVNRPMDQGVADTQRKKLLESYIYPDSEDTVYHNEQVMKIVESLREGATADDVLNAIGEADLPPRIKNSIGGMLSPSFEKGRVTGGAYPLYASIKNPFDVDKTYTKQEIDKIVQSLKGSSPEQALALERQARAWFSPNIYNKESVRGEELYKLFSTVDGADNKAISNKALQAAGYDGITHVGGSITGNEPHRVFIAFEPGQVKSAIANRGSWDAANPNMLFQRADDAAETNIRTGWTTDAERQIAYDEAMASGKPMSEEMAKSAEGYPASQGLTGARGEPIFQKSGEGEILGAYTMLFGKDGPFGMIHFGQGATPDTIAEEFAHHVISMAELPEQMFKGPEFAKFRKELRSQLDVIADAAGAPVLKYASERGPKATRRVMFQELWKVDRKASNLEDPVKWAAFQEEARAASERSAEMFKNYLKTGQAPTKELKGVFERFKGWLSGLFQVRWNKGENIPVEVKRVFDKWLTDNPEWKLTRKGQYVMRGENQAAISQAMEMVGKLKEWDKAIDNLRVAYGPGFSDSSALENFHSQAKQLIHSVKEYSTANADEMADDFLDTERGNSLVGALDDLNANLELIAEIDSGAYRVKTKSGLSLSEEVGSGFKSKSVEPSEFQKLSAKSDAEQAIQDALEEARKYGVNLPEDVDPRKAVQLLDAHIAEQSNAFASSGAGMEQIKRRVDDFWQAYADLLQDGKFHPKKLVDGKWVYPEGAGPLTIDGKLRAGQIKPPKTVDEYLAQEKGAPASLEELAALNAPNSTYVSPALLEVMKYHAGVRSYLDQWREAMLKAVDGGFLPGNTVRGLDPADADLVQKWLEERYAQIGRASSQAQALAENKTKLVMMDFESTYNLDRLMQQGPALPQWAGKAAGVRPLRVGGIVPFFKFPRENIESWINTLGNHPALIHNVGRYQEQANIERKRFNLPEQFLPTWPVQVGDKVVSVSPFAFISLGQMIRPFSPYIDEDATNVDQAIGVAGQMGFSLGPTLRLALNVLGLSQESQPIIPQAQALIPPQAYKNVSEPLQKLLGLKSGRDEFYVNRQIVFDALADMSSVTSDEAKRKILAELNIAIQDPNSPRRIAASDHYYAMKFDTANTGYWTGIYPREVSPGELDLKQYKTDLAQLRSAMVSAGLNPDQVDKIEGYIAGDPRAEANRHLNKLYEADPAKAVSGTLTEAWADSVALSGKRSEYYNKRAMIEAEFQQKYGFSGTGLTDADREDYNKRLQALGQQYADVLSPAKVVKEDWTSDEQYQRNISSLWLEYLNGTRPQFTQYKTYDEYESAVQQWEKKLPQISRQLWQTIQSPLQSLSTTRNISELPGYLDAISDKESMDRFRSQYDTVNDAIYGALRDKYYSGYWDSVNNKVGPERLLSEMEYKLRHPVPDESAIQKWLEEGLYAGRFSQQEIARELKAHPVADIENSILSGKTLPERQAYELGNLLSQIPPGNAYFDFVDSLPKDIQKHLQTFQDDSYTALQSPTKWLATYTALKEAIGSRFPRPALGTVREWVNAVHENEQMQGQRDRMFPGIKSSLDTYNAIDRGDAAARKQFRSTHPEIGKYYSWLYDEWQTSHPLWQKYYGNADAATASIGASAGGYSSRTQYVSYKKRGGGGGGGSRSYYANSYASTNGVNPVLQSQWLGFRSMAGSVLYDALTQHWDSGIPIGESENALLQSLYKQYGFGAKDFNDWLENILPKLRSAMIPGESIFSKNKRYDNEQNQPQTSFGDSSWFSKGKRAA